MSLGHGANIVTDGLVFYYDMANTKKSWKGMPTTNYYNTNTPNYYNWNSQDVVVETIEDTQKLYSTSRVGFTAIRGVTYGFANSNTKLSYSAEVRGIGSCNLQVHQANVVPDGGHTGISGAQVQLDVATWKKVSLTDFYLALDVTAQNVLVALDAGSNNYVEIRKVQIEFSDFVTPYVNGSRSNTESILDMIGNSTITNANLTYNPDGSFSYNGTNNYNSFPIPIDVLQPYTVIQILKPNVPLSTGATPPTGAGRMTSLVGPGPVWNPGIWMTNDNLRVHSDKDYKDLYIDWPDTTYRLVGMTFDGTSSKVIYQDGLFAGDRTTAYSPANPTAMYLGAEVAGGNTYNFNGEIAITMFYDRVLTASEVKQNFNALRGRFGL